MRIARLGLVHYGHLSDVELAFPAAPGMHIVLGANEAGKSTALSAIGDALFRFPHRTNYGFIETRPLQLHIDLHAHDGRIGHFIRLKRRNNDLTDELGHPVPESAIAAFLAGASRERFEHVFGLNAAALRQGGQAILEGRGEAGESILQAHTGLHGFRELEKRLDADAGRLFGDRRGRREIHAAVDRYKAAKVALEERTVEPADYKARRDEQERLEAARQDNAREAERLHPERARLERIQRTHTPRLHADRARAARAALGEVPAMPADAEARRQAAIAAREQAARDLARLRGHDADLTDRLAALVMDAALLGAGDAIDFLVADRNRIAEAQRDREELRVVAAQGEQAVAEAARQLGQAAGAAAITEKIPDALTRDAARRAIDRHVRLAERCARAREDLEAARTQQHAALAALAALPEPPPTNAMRAAIDRARAEGRIDAELAAATKAEADAVADLARALASLPLWTGTADALAAARVPLDAMITRRATALEQAGAARQAAEAKVTAHEATLRVIAGDLAQFTTDGTLPTAQAIAALRERRDRAWLVLRRHRIDGGAAPTEEELSGLGESPLPDLFERLLHEADALVDRAAGEAKLVAAFEQRRRDQRRETTARDAAAEAAASAVEAHEAALGAWRALWDPAGIVPEAPDVMREWLRRRDSILSLRLRAEQAGTHRAGVATRHAAARAALLDVVPDVAAEGVGALLAIAERICAGHELEAAARVRAQSAIETAQAAADRAARALAKTDSDLASWAEEWRRSVAALGLPADADPETGRLGLELWGQVETASRAWRSAADRIAQMTQHIDAFGMASAEVASRVAPDLIGADPHEAVRALAARLAAARSAEDERVKLMERKEKLGEEIAAATGQLAAAENALAALHALAGTDDDAALQAAIARAAQHAALGVEIAAREAELHRIDDGKSVAELAAEAEGVDVDALPGRIADIEARLRDIAEENAAIAGKLVEVRGRLEAMEAGRDAAGAAQEMEDALADIDDIAARYVRLRLAHTLLSAGINRFRAQQQGPLLAAAGALFARLTEGRYARLEVDEEDGKPSIVAVRGDRSVCPAERLSEGTRDQLYLALRLAAIESYASRTEPLPFIADDLLVNFDDRRTRAALRVLGEVGSGTTGGGMQVILFTHHAHIAEMAEPGWASLHHLPPLDPAVGPVERMAAA